jgi:hypothetical protein
MAAAEVQPFQAAGQRGDLGLQRRPDAAQRREALFAQGVDVQTVDALEVFGAQLRDREAQARADLAGVVLGDLRLAVLGVQAQADVENRARRAGRLDQIGEAGDLSRRVEDHVVRQPQYLRQVLAPIGRAIGGQLAGEELAGQPRLPQARGADAVEILPNHAGQGPHREGLQRQQHLGPAAFPHITEDRQVAPHSRLVDHEAGRGHAVQVEPGEGAGLAGLGLHRACPIRRRAEPEAPRPSRAGRGGSAYP